MNTIKKIEANKLSSGEGYFGDMWEKSWTYIKTVVDVIRQPILILDQNLRVKAANETFYKIFQVEQSDTEGSVVYELGDGQWNIPKLRELLEDILPKNTFFNGFEVRHDFPVVGNKVMMLNARRIHFNNRPEDFNDMKFPPIILLAMEDVTDVMLVAETIANRSNDLSVLLSDKTKKLENRINKIEKKMSKIKNI